MTEWIQNKVTPPCAESRRVGQERQNQLTKPQGSLGVLRASQSILLASKKTPLPSLQHIAVRVFAADHGIARAGVSAFPQSVTAEMVRNFAAGGAAITVLAHLHHADFAVINLGTAEPMELLPNVINSSLGAGTHNFSEQAAMSPRSWKVPYVSAVIVAQQIRSCLLAARWGLATPRRRRRSIPQCWICLRS
jgi:nicotinate-nucleotide--dimethylbenzimidazole phosphoribosyltransferase